MNNPIDHSLGGLAGSWKDVRYDMALGQPSTAIAHLDIAAVVMEGLLAEGSEHRFRVLSNGIPKGVEIDDVTFNPLTRTIRLHFNGVTSGTPTLQTLDR